MKLTETPSPTQQAKKTVTFVTLEETISQTQLVARWELINRKFLQNLNSQPLTRRGV